MSQGKIRQKRENFRECDREREKERESERVGETGEESYFVSEPRLEAEIALSAPARKINIAHICHSQFSNSPARPFLTLIILF